MSDLDRNDWVVVKGKDNYHYTTKNMTILIMIKTWRKVYWSK